MCSFDACFCSCRLRQIKQPLDIFLTHDWPRNIANFGNKASLLSKKPFLRSEVRQGGGSCLERFLTKPPASLQHYTAEAVFLTPDA